MSETVAREKEERTEAGMSEAPLSRLATPEEAEAFEWARETRRSGITTVNESLKQILTLATALLGGSVALISPSAMPGWAKASGCAFLLLALVVALWGSLPYRIDLDDGMVDAVVVRRRREEVQANKITCLHASAWILALAMLAFVPDAPAGVHPPTTPRTSLGNGMGTSR